MEAYMGTAFLDTILNQGNELLLNTTAKSLLLLSGVFLAIALWRKGAAATRHFLLLTSLLSLLILPLVSFLPPIWSGPAHADHVIHQWISSMAPSGNNLPTLSLVSANPTASERALAARPDNQTQSVVSSASKWRLDIRCCLLSIWAAGVFVMLCRWIVRLMLLRRTKEAASILEDVVSLQQLDGIKTELGLKRNVLLLVSPKPIMPMTWGWLQPVVLLPADAKQWPPERLRIVLLHELAHVKRRDCLTQALANVVLVFYWFNPLAWLAARRMCLERERACDDLVLHAGARPSEYAGHLLEIARQFTFAPRAEAIAMARQSSLEQRLRMIVDVNHQPSRLSSVSALAILIIMGALVLGIGGYNSIAASPENNAETAEALRQQQFARLQTFFAAKKAQSLELAAKSGEKLLPEFNPYFDAAAKGDWQTVSNIYSDFHRRHPQYKNNGTGDESLRVSYWQPLLETGLAYTEVASDEPQYVQTFVDETINSIPAGSIYFGGTDPGRGLITAFSKSHVDADSFFTVTQNALADGTYLEYLKKIYVGKIYVPSQEDSQKCFEEYLADVIRRSDHDINFPEEPKQIKPGEEVHREINRVQVFGQVAVMSVNGLLTKLIFEKNPDHEFYIEESFPLDWMNPYLEPHGLILKINRQKVGFLSNEIIQRDHKYWTRQLDPMIGGWLTSETSVEDLAAFVEKVYVQNDLSGFKGDPRLVQNENSRKLFSKLRSNIARVYHWHIRKVNAPAERASINQEAEFAYKQSFALCPNSQETVFSYVQLLMAQKRYDEALIIAETAVHVSSPQGKEVNLFRGLVGQLKSMIDRVGNP